MNKLLLIFFFILGPTLSQAQCVQQLPIELENPSFEGTPAAHSTPAPWATCGITPDTQPGAWNVTQPASDGDTYVGFIYATPSWAEGASQELSTSILAGFEYGLLIDLSATNSSSGGIDPSSFTTLQIWGSDSICDRDELLWASPTIDHVGWQTYQAVFTPSSTYSFIYFIVNGGENSYLLVDNLRPIDDGEDVLSVSTSDSLQSSCLVQLDGLVDDSLIDSLLIEGDFIGSPVVLFANDSTWSTELNFSEPGYTGISITAFSTDTTNTSIVCGQVGITTEVIGPDVSFNHLGTCSNDEFEFYDDVLPYDTNDVVGWNWDFAGLGSSMEQNPTFTFDTSGVFETQLVITSEDGCHSDTSILVEALAAPEANFVFTEVCEGHSTNFHDLSDEGDDLLNSWHWDFTDGNTSVLEDPVHTFSDTGEYQVQLVVTDYNGCADTVVQGVEVFACTSVSENADPDNLQFTYDPTSGIRIKMLDNSFLQEVKLFQANGKLILSEQLNMSEYNINIDRLVSGVYLLQVINKDRFRFARSFAVQ